MNNLQHDKENTRFVRSPKSPNILKPKPLCFKKKPRRLLSTFPLCSVNHNVLKLSADDALFLRKSPVKCINPFRRIETKRKREDDAENTEDSILSRRTKQDVIVTIREPTYQIPSARSPVLSVDEDAHMASDNCKHFTMTNGENQTNSKKKYLPIDWSLKSKIRLTSAKPFPWRNNFKTSEEASGTTGFVRCLHSDQNNCSLDSSFGAKFYQQCLVWMHPYIPWLNLFPRTDRTAATNNLPPLDEQQQEILHSKWCDSFRSLYQMVRTCQCPFFYLCASTFTVMFRSGGVGSVLDLHAAIVPTTRGLRNALNEEGIEFTMPLHREFHLDEFCESRASQKEPDCSGPTKPSVDNNEESDDFKNILVGEDEPGMWLESLGLSQDEFPTVNTNKSKLKKRLSVDHRLESLVYFEGSETQALVNFLLNYPSCVTKIGPMAGIPPTLLSPVAFVGSTLTPHKVTHAKITEGKTELYTVELCGPLLPNAVHGLCSLFNSTQDGNFSATLTSFQPTLAFSQIVPNFSNFPSAFATENLKDCGLPSPFIQQMCTKTETVSTAAINSIQAEDGLFTWH